MKTIHRLLPLCLVLFIAVNGNAQSEQVKKELQDADAKFKYAQKFEEAKKIYLKHTAHLTPQQQVHLATCYYYDPSRSAENYAEGMKLLVKASDRGNTEAMRTIAYLYQTGLGVQKDSVQQVAWTKKAADYGDAVAMTTLAYYYQVGSGGLPKDYQTAKELYLKAIEKGSQEGSYYLALMEREKGNATSFLHYLEKSAKSGFAPAQFELGELYEKGTGGVQKNIDEATRWYGKISSYGDYKDYYSAALVKIAEFGKSEPSTDLQTVKPLLLKLVSRANESFYDLKGKIIEPYNRPQFDNLGSSKNEYYAPLLDLGFKNAYIRRNNFNQLQKDQSVKNVDQYIYHAQIIHSSYKENTYKVYTQWAAILKNIFPDWKMAEDNKPQYHDGTLTLWKDNSNGRRTRIEMKTCCSNKEVQIEISNL